MKNDTYDNKIKRTPREICEELDQEVAWAMKHGKRYTDVSEMFKDILKEED